MKTDRKNLISYSTIDGGCISGEKIFDFRKMILPRQNFLQKYFQIQKTFKSIFKFLIRIFYMPPKIAAFAPLVRSFQINCFFRSIRTKYNKIHSFIYFIISFLNISFITCFNISIIYINSSHSPIFNYII